MNYNPRGRAILATCILLALLAPGFALARRPLGAPRPAALGPVNYMPFILKDRQPTTTATRTATATNTPTGTRTATATATSTATSTNTPTTTATAIALNTPTATTVPTVDALATTSLQITNGTGFALTYSIEGPTHGGGALGANETTIIPIQTGQYTVTASTHCQSVPVGQDFSTPNVIYQLNYPPCAL